MNPTSDTQSFEPFFLEGSQGRLFCIYFGPSAGTAPTASVLYVPPFAEEMNKARRQVAIQARSLASRGIAVLVPDLFGTGDSDGDLGDARWHCWLDDLRRAADWLQDRHRAPLTVWALRLGALLAGDLLEGRTADIGKLLLWQPVISGRLHMNQFFRLRVAADMIAGGEQGSTRELFDELEQGRAVEIAGYELRTDLVQEIVDRDLGRLDTSALPPVTWFEVLSADDRPIPAASRRIIEQWQAAGVQLGVETVVGEQFWSTPEIAVLPGLVTRTSAAATAGA